MKEVQGFQPPHFFSEISEGIVRKQNTNNNNVIRSTSVSDGYSPILLDSDSDDDWDIDGSPEKKPRILAALPVGFLDPLKPEERLAMQLPEPRNGSKNKNGTCIASLTLDGGRDFDIKYIKEEEPLLTLVEGNGMSRGHLSKKSCNVKQFWKAGDYDGAHADAPSDAQSAGLDHVRVHPKFLHSNATSHKWALGAFAELLDNALDEVSNGATYVHVDMLKNKKNAMLMVEDNGGGMTPDKIRQCMSLGYSAKSKLANTIGQYGNGFKTSTMRLGADVIVFSRHWGKYKRSSAQSIGMLSYSFLTETGKEDTVVPMIDYVKRGDAWKMMIRSTSEDWKRNLELILNWSPYESEEDLLQQFDSLKDQGTRIIIYNLWEDDQGFPELDFDSDKHDIQIRRANRDEKKIQVAKSFPNLRHYLTYRHSLRNYAAILYMRIPPRFRIILRGKNVEHYNIINDLIHSKVITYRPQGFPEEAPKDPNLVAVLNIGFIKDANYHLDVQGFNVYHKNRLIKPFWRVWNAAGSDGRGVIGVLEANFVQPAHDKQGFERTIVFSRLEARLVAIQKNFWSTNCHKVGYAQRVNLKNSVSHSTSRGQGSNDGKLSLRTNSKNDHRSPVEDEMRKVQTWTPATQPQCVTNCEDKLIVPFDDSNAEIKLKEENDDLRASLEDVLQELQLEKDRNKSLGHHLREERNQRELTEEALRNKLEVASNVIQELSDKVKLLERLLCKREK